MSLLYDYAGLSAVAFRGIAAEESRAGQFAGRMRQFIADLVERNWPGSTAELAIALAREHHVS